MPDPETIPQSSIMYLKSTTLLLLKRPCIRQFLKAAIRKSHESAWGKP